MLTPMRTVIVSGEGNGLMRTLDLMAEVYVIGVIRDGRGAETDIYHLSPDALVLDGVLPGGDGLAILGSVKAKMPAPPRALYLDRMGGGAFGHAALALGADVLLHGPWTEEELEAAVRKLIHIPLPGLAAHTEMQRMEIAGELLAQLDVPGQLKGWGYIQYAAACCACSGFLMQDWGRRVYPLVANRFGTSSGAVERAIRTAVENTWLTGNLQGIQQLFGFSVDADRGKPTNAEFIAMLAAHTARILDGKLQKDGGM